MATLPTPKLKRLIQLCGMLGSDFAGERATAAKMANDLLREEKTTWEELLLNGTKSTGPTPSRPSPKPVAWRVQARDCLEHPDEISAWETEFLVSILGQPRAQLSPKQTTILEKIHGRLFVRD